MEVRIKLFGKILVALDGSKPSFDALEYATTIAANCNSTELALVHVVPKVAVFGAESYFIETTSAAFEKSGKQVLVEAEKKVKQKKGKFKVSTKLLIGNPGDEIVKLAKDEKFDLIVIGSRGLHGASEWILGSVSNKVVNWATVPVFVIK
jgi:nucleotide-binding universal stress UspA family protein